MTTFKKNLNIHLQILRKQKKLIEKKVDDFADQIIKTILNNGKIFIIGNGGSAADAQHFATELTVRMRKNRIALPVLALTTDTSAITAIGNDYNFKKIFSRQLEAFGSTRDLLVAISTSGNSKNIIEAVKLSKKKNIKVIAILGNKGGLVSKINKDNFVVAHDDPSRVQEIHLIFYHNICQIVENYFSHKH